MQVNIHTLLIALTMLFGHALRGDTGNHERYLLPEDTVFIRMGLFQERIFQHTLEPGQTLYSLAKFYALSMSELVLLNPGLDPNSTKPGQRIQVRIPLSAIIMQEKAPQNDKSYVPVFYRVKMEDTLYKICHFYFNIPQKNLVQINKLLSTDLKPGQLLHLGWMSTAGISPTMINSEETDLLDNINASLKSSFENGCAYKSSILQKGPAQWVTQAKGSEDLIALHNDVPPNTVIMVQNPMNNRTLYVRVVEKIPATRYDQNIVVVLSPMAAHLLNLKNKKSYVYVTYCK